MRVCVYCTVKFHVLKSLVRVYALYRVRAAIAVLLIARDVISQLLPFQKHGAKRTFVRSFAGSFEFNFVVRSRKKKKRRKNK